MASDSVSDGPDPHPRVPKPIIKELIRTQVCLAPLELVVDRIHVVPVQADGKSRQAYRLWLTDGHKSIQAVLKREIHPFVSSGEIEEGSYVNITDYHLASAKRRRGSGDIQIIQITDLNAICFDDRPHQSPRFEQTRPQIDTPPTETQRRIEQDDLESPVKLPVIPDTRIDHEHLLQAFESIETEFKARETLESPSQRIRVETPRLLKRKLSFALSPLESISGNSTLRPEKAIRTGDSEELAHDMASDCDIDQFPNTLRSISRPLDIMPLARLTGPRTVRNKIHDVLAIVCSVDPQSIKRRGMPDQRNLRILDASTTKKVQLTVFVDATAFTPAVGTVAIFRNVTTHEWDGGSLKAYQRDCEGRRWYIPNPAEIDQGRIHQLQKYWRSMQHGQ